LLFIPNISGKKKFFAKIFSRVGIFSTVIPINDINFDLYFYIKKRLLFKENITCVFVDEVHFLKKNHIFNLIKIVDVLNIPVFTYGLRSDFLGNYFEGSLLLLLLADKLIEIEAICFCGNKAIMTARINKNNKKRIFQGTQIKVGGNESYVSLCRKHFFSKS
jgi:thymidine kinase